MQLSHILIAAVYMAAAAIGGISLVKKCDRGSQLKLDRRGMAALAAASFLLCGLMGGISDGVRYLHVTTLLAYLLVMAYTDMQTGMVYTVFSLLMMILEGGLLFLAVLGNKELLWMEPAMLLLFAVYILMHLFMERLDFMGMGDVLIFIVLLLFYCNTVKEPLWLLTANTMLAHLIFVIKNAPKYFELKKYEQRQPFTLSIATAAGLTIMLLMR